MKHQHFWSLSVVTCTQKHGARFGQRSVRWHEEVNAFCRCWDINWEVLLQGQWGKLSEIFNGYRRGRVPCNSLQGHHLLKATGETAGCCQQARLVERQGAQCRHCYAIRSSASKSSHCCSWWIYRNTLQSRRGGLYRQTYRACCRVKPLWNRAAITAYVIDSSNVQFMWAQRLCAENN